jgi:hypothetical protein
MADNDDFDEWLDDVETDDDGELDQLNIDALLSAVDDNSKPDDSKDSTTSELDQTNIDALLGINSNSPEEETDPAAQDDMEELDQDNIDALLNDTTDDIPEPEESTSDEDELDQDNIDALLSGSSDDTSDELDQDNIDALLNDTTDDIAKPEESIADDDELDQDNIDALLSGENEEPAETTGSETEPEEIKEEPDQDELDTLLAENTDTTPETETEDSGQNDPDEEAAAESSDTGPKEADQDDIDALFNDIDAATSPETDQDKVTEDQSLDELFAEDDDKTTLSAETAEENSDTAFDSEFDEMDQLFSELEDDTSDTDDPFQTEEIDFAEMLDSSDSDGEDEFLSLGDDDEEDEFVMDGASENDGNETDIDALLAEDDSEENNTDDSPKTGFVIPPFISGMNKTTMSAIGGGLVLLLIVGFYFIFSGGDSKEIITSGETIVAENNTPSPTPAQENFIPTAEDNTYTLDQNARELAIDLQGSDEDGQPLIYKITSIPGHGRLSGTAPHFTYLANTDFPGEDSFEYTVNDGIDTSAIAHITITGPDLKSQALAQKIAEENRKQKIIAKEIKAKQAVVLAKNVHFYTDSTTPVTVDWRRIWQEANKSDYNPRIHVEIVKIETAGHLGKVSSSRTTFTPDPYSEGTDLIFYRFKKNGFRSATKTISIDISLGNPAPEINIAELKKGYPVGQRVALDTSPSRDDAPESLQFRWEQTSGVPVSMNIQNDGRKMTFIMPSSFYNKGNSDPVFKITATDKTGKTSSREIITKTISRRQAALWRGSNGGIAEDPALKGQYFPWPYDDE